MYGPHEPCEESLDQRPVLEVASWAWTDLSHLTVGSVAQRFSGHRYLYSGILCLRLAKRRGQPVYFDRFDLVNKSETASRTCFEVRVAMLVESSRTTSSHKFFTKDRDTLRCNSNSSAMVAYVCTLLCLQRASSTLVSASTNRAIVG